MLKNNKFSNEYDIHFAIKELAGGKDIEGRINNPHPIHEQFQIDLKFNTGHYMEVKFQREKYGNWINDCQIKNDLLKLISIKNKEPNLFLLVIEKKKSEKRKSKNILVKKLIKMNLEDDYHFSLCIEEEDIKFLTNKSGDEVRKKFQEFNKKEIIIQLIAKETDDYYEAFYFKIL